MMNLNSDVESFFPSTFSFVEHIDFVRINWNYKICSFFLLTFVPPFEYFCFPFPHVLAHTHNIYRPSKTECRAHNQSSVNFILFYVILQFSSFCPQSSSFYWPHTTSPNVWVCNLLKKKFYFSFYGQCSYYLFYLVQLNARNKMFLIIIFFFRTTITYGYRELMWM